MVKKFDSGFYFILGGLILFIFVFKGVNISVPVSCDVQPENPDCNCFGGTMKVGYTECNPIEGGQGECEDVVTFKCEEAECTPTTVEINCKDKVHIQCVGNWECTDGMCDWQCD